MNDQIPDVVGPVHGWRTLDVARSDKLISPMFETAWRPGQWVTAECKREPIARNWQDLCRASHGKPRTRFVRCICVPANHKTPHKRCGCGIYVPDTIRWLERVYHLPIWKQQLVHVEVKGRYVRHSCGWRVEHARVVGIVNTHDEVAGWWRARRVAWRFRVPLMSLAEARQLDADTPGKLYTSS